MSRMTLVSRIDICSALASLWDGYATFCVMAVGWENCKKLILFMYVFIYLTTLSVAQII